MQTKVHHLKNGYANCYVLEEDGLVVVDCGFKWKSSMLKKEFASRNLNPGDVRLIIITHGHYDHFGGIHSFLELCDNPPVLCHKNAASALESGKGYNVTPRNSTGRIIVFLSRFITQKASPCKPDRLISYETDLGEYGITGRIIPTPGHSSCSVSVLLSDGRAILGDTIMPDRKGKAGAPYFLENTAELDESYGKLLHLITDSCYSGHGGPYGADEVIALMHHTRHIHGEIK